MLRVNRFVGVVALSAAVGVVGCGQDDPGMGGDSGGPGTDGGGGTDTGGGADTGGGGRDGAPPADGSGGGGGASCGDFVLAPLDDDPDEGFIDITEFCLEEINMYRAMEDLEPYTIKEDGRCCSALEARQALMDGTGHNGDYCDWAAQGSAGGGRNPSGTARASVEWVPRLFWRERGDTFEESGGHYQAMMRPGTREIACGWYASDRDNHRVMVNYW